MLVVFRPRLLSAVREGYSLAFEFELGVLSLNTRGFRRARVSDEHGPPKA